MPTLADFLARVIDWPKPGEPGFVNLHWRPWRSQGVTGGRAFKELPDLLSWVNWAAYGAGVTYVREIYFCTSLQKEAGPPKKDGGPPTALRNRQNTLSSRTIFSDIDKGYASPDLGLAAVVGMCRNTGSPFPSAVVQSGNGIHVYWINTASLAPEEWDRYAHGLDILLTAHGVVHDPVTTDITRILRPPGTFNNKGHEQGLPAKPVTLLLLGDDVDFTTWTALNAVRPAPTTALGFITPKVSGQAPDEMFVDPLRRNDRPSAVLLAALKTEDWIDNVIDPTPVFQCPMFKETLAVHGAGISQPLWHQQALACTFLRDGEKLFHELSSGHAQYSFNDTEAMFARKVQDRITKDLGYPSCAQFEKEQCAQCATCPLRGTIVSPLNLRGAKPAPGMTPAPAPPPPSQGVLGVQPSPQSNPHNVVFPKPEYICDPHNPGHIGYVFTDKRAKLPVPEFRELLTSECYDFRMYKDAVSNKFSLSFTSSFDKDRYGPVTLSTKDMETAPNLKSRLGEAGVSYLPSNADKLVDLMASFLSKMKQEDTALASAPYGWVSRDGKLVGFAYGGDIYMDDGTKINAVVGDAVMQQAYTPRGTEEAWLKCLKILIGEGRPELQTLMLAGFAAPLIKLAGQYSGTLMTYGDPGAHKSSALAVALALWGSPKLTKNAADSSALGIAKNMSEVKHLLVGWDDIHADLFPKVATMLMNASGGVEGNKLDTNRNTRLKGEWATMIATTSNASIAQWVTQKHKNDTGHLVRVFEYQIKKPEKDPTQAIANVMTLEISHLDDNFGNFGRVYAKLLGEKHANISELLLAQLPMIDQEVAGIRDEERFWVTVFQTVFTAGILANMLLPPDIRFDMDKVKYHLKTTYLNLREQRRESSTEGSSEDFATKHLAAFLSAYSRTNTIWTVGMNSVGRPKKDAVKFLNQAEYLRESRQAPTIHFVRDRKLLRIARGALETYCLEQEVAFKSLMDGLKQYYGATVKDRVKFGEGCNVGYTYDVPVVLPLKEGTWLFNLLCQHDTDQTPEDLIHLDQSEADPHAPTNVEKLVR